MATENTHSQVVAAAGQAAAGEVTVGTITFPAGGPWKIHHVFGLLASATQTAGECNAGAIRVETVSGDLTPQPAPARFPLIESGSALGATLGQPVCPLQIYDVDWEAAGKAIINMNYIQRTAVTVAPQLVLGVLYGRERPELAPIRYSDRVSAAVTLATATALGTITLSEKATRITGVCAIAVQDNVITAGEQLIGYITLASNSIDFTPMQVPFSAAFGAGLGALIQGANNIYPVYLPMDIPVIGGAIIDVACLLNTAVTNAANVEVFIAYQ